MLGHVEKVSFPVAKPARNARKATSLLTSKAYSLHHQERPVLMVLNDDVKLNEAKTPLENRKQVHMHQRIDEKFVAP